VACTLAGGADAGAAARSKPLNGLGERCGKPANLTNADPERCC